MSTTISSIAPAVCDIAASPAWHDFHVPTFAGQGDTNKGTGEPYATMPLADLFTTPVFALAKLNGPAIIPSLYAGHDSRSHRAQREQGQFVALTGDIDKGDHPLEAIEAVVREFAGDAACLVHSSASSRPGHRKWRIIIPLAAPVDFQTWHIAQKLFHDHLAAAGIEPDRALVRAGQIIFAPNVPAVHEGTGTPLREGGVAEGKPLYFESSQSDIDAEGLDLCASWLTLEIMVAREAIEAEEARRRAAADEAKAKRAARAGAGSTAIERFNATNDLADLLVQYGYEDSPSNGADWRSPHQQSGSYATRAYAGGDGRQYWVSMSQSDREAGLGRECASGCHGDAFDLFAHYEHDGDRDAALAAFREAEAVHAFDGVVIDAPEYKPRPSRKWVRAGDPVNLDQQWLIHNRLPVLGTAALVAPSRAGKTFILAKLAACLAKREAFYGIVPDEKVATIILAGEGFGGMVNRLSVLGGNLPISAMPVSLMRDTTAMKQIVADIREEAEYLKARYGLRLGLIAVDTLAAAGLVAQENDNSEGAAAVKLLEMLSSEFHCLTMVACHPPKGGTGVRGASSLDAGFDTIFEIFYNGADVRFIEITKGRDAPTAKLGSFTLVSHPLGISAKGHEITTCTVSMGIEDRSNGGKATLVSTLAVEQVASCQEAITDGNFRAAVQCGPQWAGHAIGKALGIGTTERAERTTVRSILDTLIVEGWLQLVTEKDDVRRKAFDFVRVGKPAVGDATGVDQG